MDTKEKMIDCLAYFRARPVYDLLFTKIKEKYESLGHFGGRAELTDVDDAQKRELSGFFQKDYTGKDAVVISAAQMQKALDASRFAGLSWEEILEAYFGQLLVSKREQRERLADQKDRYFNEILAACPDTHAGNWLRTVLSEKTEGYSLLMQQYRDNPEALKETFFRVSQAIAELPYRISSRMPSPVRETKEDSSSGKTGQGNKTELLPVFAAKITGNPHYFDEGTTAEKLLTAYLKSVLAKEILVKENPAKENHSQISPERSAGSSAAASELKGAEFKSKLYYEAGIIKDALSNDVLAYGIHGTRKDGTLHPGIEGFAACREPVRLTLQTISGLAKACGTDAAVFVVENPAVFAVLADRFPQRTILCGNGQVNLAVLTLMDKMTEDSHFYYAGDFDPEGLLIAQRLKLRYGEKLSLWNYKTAWYEKYKSDVVLSDTRLKKLEGIVLPELAGMKAAILKEKRAAYQEAMMEEIL